MQKFLKIQCHFQGEVVNLLMSVQNIKKNTEQTIEKMEKYFQKMIDEFIQSSNEYINFGNIDNLYFKGITNYNNVTFCIG